MDRCFWSFQGPFETFLYLDADMICIKPLESLRQRVVQQQGNFIYAHTSISHQEWLVRIQNPDHPEHLKYTRQIKRDIGRDSLMLFDPDYDPFANCPFNAGVFVSRRLAITEFDLQSLNQAEREFYRNVLKKKWTWKKSKLFFRDQGRLNYLVSKLSIPTARLRPDLVSRSGASAIQVSFEDVKRDACEFHMIHWMDSIRPSPSWFCVKPLFTIYAFLWSAAGRGTDRWMAPEYHRLKECPGYSLWRHYYEQSYGAMPLGERLRWSWRDLKRTCELLVRWLMLSLRKRGCGVSGAVGFRAIDGPPGSRYRDGT